MAPIGAPWRFRTEPRLLILDPLVRLHGVDENAVADIAPTLGFLTDTEFRRLGALFDRAEADGGVSG